MEYTTNCKYALSGYTRFDRLHIWLAALVCVAWVEVRSIEKVHRFDSPSNLKQGNLKIMQACSQLSRIGHHHGQNGDATRQRLQSLQGVSPQMSVISSDASASLIESFVYLTASVR